VTFYRTNAPFTAPSRDLGDVIGTAETNANGVASLLIDGFDKNQANTTSTIHASLELPDTTVITSTVPATVNFLQRTADPPTFNMSQSPVKPGENITLTVTARDRDGNNVPQTNVLFTVRGSASLIVYGGSPGLVNVTRQAPGHVLAATDRNIDREFTYKTDNDGVARIILNSPKPDSASVSAQFWLEGTELVPLPVTYVPTWVGTPPPGVNKITLAPPSQTVYVGHYAQVFATLTPALPGVKVDFTAVRVSPLEAQLDSATNDTDALSWGEPVPDTTAQEAQLATDPTNPGTAEVAYHKRPGAGNSRTETSSALSNSLGVATVSLWHRRPATYHVTASVTNPDNVTVTSNPVTVSWVSHDSSYGDSDSPYYKTHPGHDDYYPGDHGGHNYKHNRPEDYHGSKGSEGPYYKHGGEEYRHDGGKHSESPYKNHGHSGDYSAKKHEKDHYKKGHEDTHKHAK
jgi:hypothetical protein